MLTVTNRVILTYSERSFLPRLQPGPRYFNRIHATSPKGTCRQFSARLPNRENRFKYSLYAIAAVCIGLFFGAGKKKETFSENPLEEFTKNEVPRLLDAALSGSEPISWEKPCPELVQNCYDHSPSDLNSAIIALNGKEDRLSPLYKMNYDLLGRLIASIETTLKDPTSIESIETRWLDLCIHQQIKKLFLEYSSHKPTQQMEHPLHPRTIFIQRMIELWYVVPHKDNDKSLYWMPSSIINPCTDTETINIKNRMHLFVIDMFSGETLHAGPFCYQPIPMLNAALLMKLSVSTNPSDRECLINQVIPKFIEHYQGFSYGSTYSLPHLIAGVIQEAHLPQEKKTSHVAKDALQFSGILFNPLFSEENRKDWFKFLLEGKFGGKSEQWFDALVCLHNKEETEGAWKNEIQSVLNKEAGFFSANSKLAGTALQRLKV